MKLHINRTLVLRVADDGQNVEMAFTRGAGRRVVGELPHPAIGAWLLTLTDPTTRQEAATRAATMLAMSMGEAEDLVTDLCERGALVERREVPTAIDASVDRWIRWGWRDALDFHLSVRDAEFLEGDEAGWSAQLDLLKDQIMAGRNGVDEPTPGPYKDYPEAKRIVLPRARRRIDAASFGETLHARRTCRNFTGQSISVEELAELLEHSAGMQGELDYQAMGIHLSKTTPSGGGRHPTEVYPIVHRVEGLEPGLYHYSVRHHALELLKAGDFEDCAYDLAHKQIGMKNTAVACLFTARWGRHMWKYRDGRNYRAVLFDVGHLVQTQIMLATALGLGTFLTPALRDTQTSKFLELPDDLEESPLYVTAYGR